MSYCLGVDLGTTFVAAAIAHDTRVEMFALGDRSTVMPAAVYLRDDGTLATGDAAARRAVSSPDRVASEIKRRLGDPTPILLGGRSHAVTDLLGTLLQDVLARVTSEERADPDVVVLTHPANWGPFRRELFEDVPRFAGLSSALTVTEPEAAAAYYAATRQIAEGEVIAVYDLGGGTFDATVLQRTADGIEILGAPEGVERLGGADFDEAILSFVNHASGGALAELDLSDPKTVVAVARLRQDCVLAKEALSLDTEASIPVFLPARHLDVRITRPEFEDMIRAPVESTIGTLSRALRTAEVSPGQLSAVLLVGGSSRIPLVARMISEELGRPTVVDAHPKHAVALGAATLAQVHAGAGAARVLPVVTPEPRTPAVAAPLPPPPRTPSAAETVAAPVLAAPVATLAPTSPRPPGHGGSSGGRNGAAPARNGRPPAAHPAHGADAAGANGHVPGAGGVPPAAPGGADSDAPAPPPQPPPRDLRRPLLIGAAALVLVLAVVVAFVLLRPDPGTRTSGGGTAAPTAPSVPPPATGVPTSPAPAVASSVPIPTVGGSIPVGPTPGFVVVSPSGRQLFVANRAAGYVTVVDTALDKVTGQIRIDAGPPQFLAFSPQGDRLYVSVFNDAKTIHAVAVVDTKTNKVLKTIQVRTRPYVPAVTPDGTRLFVPNHDSGTISVIDTRSLELVREITVPPNPHWIEFTPDGSRAWVANHESNMITEIDPATLEVVARVPVGKSPHSVAVHRTRPLVANVNYDDGTVTFTDTDTRKVITTLPVSEHPQDVTWSADGRFAYVTNVDGNEVTVISADTFEVTARIPNEGNPTSIAVLPDGSRAFVSNLGAGTLTVLDLTG